MSHMELKLENLSLLVVPRLGNFRLLTTVCKYSLPCEAPAVKTVKTAEAFKRIQKTVRSIQTRF